MKTMKTRAILLSVCGFNLALCLAGFANPGPAQSAQVPVANSSSETGEGAHSASNAYQVEGFSIKLDAPGSEEVQLSLEYNDKTYYEGVHAAPGDVELLIEADTDFDDPPKRGHSSPERIYLYLRSPNYASQWHTLKRTGRELRFTDGTRLKMYRKRYVVIEYAFYQGDDPSFEGRTPTYSGIAAVGHWGSLPGFNHDWQVWQGSRDGGLWGDTLRLEFHRGTSENGMIESSEEYEDMTKAPESGYRHFGGCGTPSKAAAAGNSYYCRIVGHTERTRGYGKIRIKEITETPPEGMDVLGG